MNASAKTVKKATKSGISVNSTGIKKITCPAQSNEAVDALKTDNKKVILYVRVSHENQVTNGQSIDNQIYRLKNYAEMKGYRNVIVLSDNGISAKNMKRASFIKMIEMVRADEVEAIIVLSLSRFARNLIDTLNTLGLLNEHNVTFHSLSESVDTSTAVGRFFLTVLASLAQLEREQVGERIKSVLQFKKLNGERMGKLNFGFQEHNGKLIKDKTEQNTLRIIRTLRNKKEYTYAMIAETLMKRERNNKNGRVFWNKSMVFKLYNSNFNRLLKP